MQTIYLVRHGQKQFHFGEASLTDIGVNQAIQTGQYLSNFPIHKIIASPFKRTVETAHHIGNVLGLDHTIDERLIERMEWKDDNVSKNEFFKEWVKATSDRNYIPKYGDSSINTGLRVEQLVKSLPSVDSHILLVTHGGAITDYLRNIFGDEKLSKLKKQYDVGEDFAILNCSISKVVLDENPILELLNYSDHLEKKSG